MVIRRIPIFETTFSNEPTGDVEPEVPPYEGRKTSADSGDETVKSRCARGRSEHFTRPAATGIARAGN
ncbi:hypothetical protein MAGR_66540 [Mycolicibacterium agri]|uniref:Uncharacterized protein n=1 Tax=Mycolicibacterium agri TaxID=36811 RepID=A0A7I9WBW0_MYCAG|nr:hypothetical protein MAGR_66540 [Mycolicibacterium agri]